MYLMNVDHAVLMVLMMLVMMVKGMMRVIQDHLPSFVGIGFFEYQFVASPKKKTS